MSYPSIVPPINVQTKRDGPEAQIFTNTTLTEPLPGLNIKYKTNS